MTGFATPGDIAHRTAAARNAAVAAGRDLGLEITEGEVLYELFSVVVHLKPSPVVAPEDLRRAEQEWEVLEPLVTDENEFRKAFPGVELQPVHGDSPPANIFASTNGPLFSDFELVTRGPVEWDLGGLGPEHEAAYDRGAAKNGLRALDKDVLRFVNAVGAIRVIAYLSCADQLPAMVEFMQPFINQWRDTEPYA
ncbi:phosphotransferase [Lentzea aerocolonigenes]|uniref:phosphotransferase n=1 Tax=Lentzea aerocolonigenes TaxID=68170 RepID=UPI0004C35204|nr:phosphotransferase [Lentzea aerocolonigenes]MCP2245421.1 Phosphotransferase enzyme family protein [Lentzea aerocolonigenes]